jgi:hypothetical protein
VTVTRRGTETLIRVTGPENKPETDGGKRAWMRNQVFYYYFIILLFCYFSIYFLF